MQPFVSVITPTKDRRHFIPHLLEVYRALDWPEDQRELIVLDDGRDPVRDLLQGEPGVTYERLDIRQPIGTKRNLLCEMAKGDVIVHIDDDDYHPPGRIQQAIDTLEDTGADVVGTSRLAFYDVGTKAIHVTHPIGKKHAFAGTMAYRRSYWQAHAFAPDPHKEERQFLQNFFAKLSQIQAEPWEVMLCISHGDNILPKNTAMPRAPVTLDQVVPIPALRKFYESLEEDEW